MDMPAMVGGFMESYAPFAGATSFAEADAYERAEDSSEAVGKLTQTFNGIVSNILGDMYMDLSAKADAVVTAARDLKTRLQQDPQVNGLPEVGEAAAGGGFMARFKKKPKPGADAAAMMTPEEMVAAKKKKANPFAKKEGEAVPGAFRAWKDLHGRTRFVAVHSNNFYDREGEVFPAERHREFERWVDETKEYPELLVWHVPGARLGQADMITFDSNGFMVSSGTIDPGMEGAAERLGELGALGVSHGYYYDEKSDDGVFGRYRSFEISVLPLERAANELTGFAVEEVPTMLPAAKKEALVQVFGPEFTATLEANLTDAGKRARAKGLGSKEMEPVADALGAAMMSGFKDEPTEGTPPPAAAVPDAAALVAAVQTAIAPFAAQLNAVAAGLTETQEAVKALSASDDEKIAAQFRPRLGLVGMPGAGTKEQQEAESARILDEAKKELSRTSDIDPKTPAYMVPILELMNAAAGGGPGASAAG